MQRMEMSVNVIDPRHEPIHDQQPTERRSCKVLLLSFGLLCLIQASLNISLRLAGKERANPEGTQTPNPCEPITVVQKSSQCNNLQERFNALTKEKNLLENHITELNNQIRELNNQIKGLKVQRSRQLEISNGGAVCPDGWRQIKDRCYFLSTEKRTWNSSRKLCQSLGADLVVINSLQEQKALYEMNDDPYLLVWIGLYDENNGSFRWVDNTALTITFWQRGEPDDGGPNKVEDCVEMYHHSPVTSSWNDAPCGDTRKWFCEKEALHSAP